MRLVLSIVSFSLAVIFLGAGIAQRTIFLQPGSVVETVSAPATTVYTVLGPSVLQQHSGAPTLSATGTGTMTVAYGRTDDVLAWIGAAEYTQVDIVDGQTNVQTVTPDSETVVEPDAPSTGSPAGSDLWLNEGTGDGAAFVTSNVPDGYSAIVAADGSAPAPSDLRIAWPIDNSTPWVGPFLVLGAVLFIVGAVLFWLNWRDTHRAGPRRKGVPAIESPTRRALPASRAPKRRELGPARGRRAFFTAVALVTVTPVLLSGCSAEYWPGGTGSSGDATPAPTTTSADGTTSLEPAVTVPQMERILSRISEFANAADTGLARDQLSLRFAGPALAARDANYVIRSRKADYAVPVPIPAQPLTITLPQQVDRSWPRLVMTVSQNADDPTQAPVALVLLQNSPRDNYHVYYAITLVPNAQSPQLAPASIGAPRLAADSKLLKLQPNQLGAAYGDVLNQGEASQSAPLFLADGDTLLQQLGLAGQEAIRAQLPANSAIAFSASPGSAPALALATNDAGAIVAIEVDQLRRITPTDGGVVGFADGSASAALSGFTAKSPRGVQSTSGLQLLFYVPSVDSGLPIQLLGWTESLIAASEIF
ncbi:MAG: hypothetical protein ACKOXM_04870 [Agromyces sp.]